MNHRLNKIILGLSGAAAIGLPVAAYGQESNNEIIVTARRVEERLQDVPISITVFNQQQISERNVVTASDLAIYTPSLSSTPQFGADNASYAIRGFVQNAGTAPTVGVYFADVVAPRAPTGTSQAGDGAGPGFLFDLQNTQVLKGPQGTLQGRNTTGGAIIFMPQKPTWNLEGYVEGSYGNLDMTRLQGAINIPLGDKARFRIAADYMDRDGWLKNTTGIGPSDFNDVHYIAVRGSLVVDLTPNLENYTIVSYLHSSNNGSVGKQIDCAPGGLLGGIVFCPSLDNLTDNADGDFYAVQSTLPNATSKIDQWQIINTTSWMVGETVTIKNIASYAQMVHVNRTALFGTNIPNPNPLDPNPIQFSGFGPPLGVKTANAETITEELQIQASALDSRLSWQSGVYIELTNPLGTIGNQSPSNISCVDLATFQCANPYGFGNITHTTGTVSYRNLGLYGQANFKLSDQFKLTGGFRYTWDKVSAPTTRGTYRFGPAPLYEVQIPVCPDTNLPGMCTDTLEQKSSAPTWLIGLDYTPAENALIYAKYSRGYRSGGVYVYAPIGSRNFEQEKLDTYEGGFKTSWGGALSGTLNASAFYNKFSDQQLQVGFSPSSNNGRTNTIGILNIGKSRIYGVEVEGSISPFEGFSIDGSYSYLNTKITDIVPAVSADPAYILSGSTQAGDRLPFTPKNKFSISARYTLPLPDSAGKLSLGATFSHSDRVLTNYAYLHSPAIQSLYDGANYSFIDAINLVNLNANWNSVGGSPVDLSIFASNVTKEKYFSYIPGIASAGGEFATLGEPRMYGMRLRYRFGY